MSFNHTYDPIASPYERQSFTPIPKGIYSYVISNAEVKYDKQGCQYLFMELKITEGDYAGRVIFKRFHLNSSNEIARSIAKKDLDGVHDSIGLRQVLDVSMYINKRLKGYTKVKEAKDGYDASNDISVFYPLNEKTLDHHKATQEYESMPIKNEDPSLDDVPF
jgi:hypothetical protein